MNKFRFTLMALAIMAFTLMISSSAQAQATRTWVSGVGDDVNPCSRTAPCKTFAGAISKTATDGEIDCLDPGGFGSVTITKSITIDGGTTGEGSILASGTQAILVSVATAGVTSAVQIRNISMNGAGTGTNGVRILNGTTTGINVEIERCVIFGFRAGSGRGISDERTVAGGLFVQDTLVKNNSGSGIVAIGSASGLNVATLDNVQSWANGATGIVVSGGNRQMVIRNSSASKNGGIGIGAEVGAKLEVINSLSSFNATGIDAATAGTEVRVSRTTVTRNTVNGLGLSGGTLFSYGTNEVAANTGNELFTPGGPNLK
jgi:hypothetical protein